ncbi:hypothetical protein JCM24511_03001 [Saitozyma sp. JCM 24511]|nr:hypothetical protein JCM24511_03001 [Saitozyma sp. JCM 24511]
MAAPNPLSSLPSSGTFPVNLAPSLLEAFDPPGKKRKRSDEELIGLRCEPHAFKPASITPSTPGSLNIDPSGSRQLAFETPSGGEQVFDAKEETGRSRECVLLWDETTSTFTLHALPTTLVLTLNRSLSSTSRKVPAKATSVASSSSSASVPLATKRAGGSPVVEEALPKKRSRPSEVVPPPAPAPAPALAPMAPSGRAVKGGKSLPRKTLPAHAPLPPVEPVRKAKAPAKGRGGAHARGGKAAGTSAAGKRGGKAAAAAPPKGKFKSAEIIEDSDDEDVDADADGGNEMADEFARMVGESLAAAPSTEAEGEDEEEYEEEDDDEGELGGARLVVNDSGGGYDDHSEWL